MNVFILVLVGVAGVWLGMRMARARQSSRQENVSVAGARNVVEKREKEARKAKVLEFLQANERITNDDVEDLVGVSDATAGRYLEELEQEGKIVQKGETGRFVYYVKS